VIEAPELVDHVPYVPRADETPASWIGFFDGYTDPEAAAGQQIAETLAVVATRVVQKTSGSR